MRAAFVVRVLSSVVVLGTLVPLSAPAHAQSQGLETVKLGTTIKRAMPLRQTGQKPLWVNRDDCVNHDVLSFSLSMTGYQQGNTLQVWAGTVDCTPTDQRKAGSGATCWQVFGQVYTAPQQSGNGFVVPIYARNVVNAGAQPVLSGTVTTTNLPEAPESVCNSGSTQQPKLYFMLVDGSGTIANGGKAFDTWSQTAFDLAAPAPPSGIVLGGGEQRINLSWSPSSDADITGYNFYCDPPPGPLGGLRDSGAFSLGPSLGLLAFDAGVGAGGLGGGGGGAGGSTPGAGGASGFGGAAAGGTDSGTTAGAGGSAGTGGTTAAGADAGRQADGSLEAGAAPITYCAPTSLRTGKLPDGAFLCGSTTGKSASTGKAENLVNGQLYSVAIGAVDTVGNVGVLSVVECASPLPVTDFFELYRDLGGQGGGGLCSLSRRGSRSGSRWPVGALGLVVAATIARRLRRPL